MKKRVALKAIALVLSVFLFVTFIPVTALPESTEQTAETETVSDATQDAAQDAVQDAAQDEEQSAASETPSLATISTDAIVGNTVVVADSTETVSVKKATVSAASTKSTSGSTPYDPLNTDDENDPFLQGGDAYITQSEIFYGAPATPTYPLTKWAANTSVVNTSLGAFSDVDLIDENSMTVDAATAATGGKMYDRYDATYGKYGVTFDRNVSSATWTVNKTLKLSGTPYLYFSIEQTDSSSMALAVRINNKWYVLTDNSERPVISSASDGGSNMSPNVTILTRTTLQTSNITDAQKVTGSITGCIDMTEWLPALIEDAAACSYDTLTYTIQKVAVFCYGDEAARVNYLYFGTSTGDTLMPQINGGTVDTGSDALNNGWENSQAVTVNCDTNGSSIVIDGSKANLNGDYATITIPVRRWFNVLNSARELRLIITSSKYQNSDYHPVVSLWGNGAGKNGSWFEDEDGVSYSYRYECEDILAILGTGYYLTDGKHTYGTSAYHNQLASATVYNGDSNRYDILRGSGVYSNMVKAADEDDGITDEMVGWVYVSAIRVVVYKDDVVTIGDLSLHGNPGGINDTYTYNGGSGVQPIVETGEVTTTGAAAFGPLLSNSTYTSYDLLNREDATVYGQIFKVTMPDIWNNQLLSIRYNYSDHPDNRISPWASEIPVGAYIMVTATIGSYDSDYGWFGYTCYKGNYGWVTLKTPIDADHGYTYSYSGAGVLHVEQITYRENATLSLDASTADQAATTDKWQYSSFLPAGLGILNSATSDAGTAANLTAPMDAKVWTSGTAWFNGIGDSKAYTNSDTSSFASASATYNQAWIKQITTGRNSVTRSVDVELKQYAEASSDLALDPDLSDQGYPVLYYDFDFSGNSDAEISIALTIKKPDDSTYIVYLTADPNSSDSTQLGLYQDWTTTQLTAGDSAQRLITKKGTYCGYVSTEWIVTHGQLNGGTESIVAVSIYSSNYSVLTMRRLEVLTNDKEYEEFLNTNQPEIEGSSSVRYSGTVDMYDSINLLKDVQDGSAKGWGLFQSSGFYAGGDASVLKAGYSTATGIQTITVGANSTEKLLLVSNKLFNTSNYKYLYFSFAMQTPGGVGYASSDQGGVQIGLKQYWNEAALWMLDAESATWTYANQYNINNESDSDFTLAPYHFASATMGAVDLSTLSYIKALGAVELWFQNNTNQTATYYINYIYLSNVAPSEVYTNSISNEVVQYIYLMDSTGDKYSTRFPTVENPSGIVTSDDQRVNPIKVTRGKTLQEGTYYNGVPLGSNSYSTDNIWFYTRTGSNTELDTSNLQILDYYQYLNANGDSTVDEADLSWSYGRWLTTQSDDRLYKTASGGAAQGLLLSKFGVENQVLLRTGIAPIKYTTYYDTQGGQMWYSGTPQDGPTVNEDNYYITQTALDDYYSFPITGGKLLNPTRVGYTFLGWYTEPDGGEKIETWHVKNILANNVGDNYFYAHWAEDTAYRKANSFAVTFYKDDNTTEWFTRTADGSNDYIITLPSSLQMQTVSGTFAQIAGWKEKDGTRVFSPGAKLIIASDTTLVPVIGDDADGTSLLLTIRVTDARLFLYRGEDAEPGEVSTQQIKETRSGSTYVYENVPANLSLVAIPLSEQSNCVWQASFDNAAVTSVKGNSATVVSLNASQYVFTAFSNMNLEYTTSTGTSVGDANKAIAWSCPNVPVVNQNQGGRQMDFYAQFDLSAVSGAEFVACGTLYTKAGTAYDAIKNALDANMRLDETKLASGTYSTVTSSVRQITASAHNSNGQYRLSVTENKGNAITYYTRAYCVYKLDNKLYVVYSDVISSASVPALSA